MRQIAAVLLCCALFSAGLLAGPATEAHAQASGQAVVDNAMSYIGSLRHGLLRLHLGGAR